MNRYLQLLSKIFSIAYDNGYVDSNPCRRVRNEKEGGKRERYLTFDEEVRLTKALTGEFDYMRPAVEVSLGTGLRKSELIGLKIEHVNFGSVPMFYPVNGRDVEVLPNCLLVVQEQEQEAKGSSHEPASSGRAVGGHSRRAR